jgi:hypothetical protein
MNRHELETLIGAVLDEEATPEERKRLEAHLAEHPDDRRLFERLERQHLLLTDHFDEEANRLRRASSAAAERAAATPVVTHPRVTGWPRLRRLLPPLAAAAVLLALLVLALNEGPPEAAAEDRSISVTREDFTVTVFNPIAQGERYLFMPFAWTISDAVDDAYRRAGDVRRLRAVSRSRRGESYIRYPVRSGKQGMAFVRDRRLVEHLKKGRNTLRFTDVAATIDPTSVRLHSDTDPNDFAIVEQNFEFDLASAEALLTKYIDRPIACVTRDDDTLEGELASFDPGSITLIDPETGRTQTINRARLRTIRLEELPENLVTRPTLVWEIDVETPGPQRLTLSYLCGDAEWLADYTALIHPSNDENDVRLDLTGWVSMTNRSGATFPNANLKLIAGDVHRVRDPWAISPKTPMLGYGKKKLEANAAPQPDAARKVFTEKRFFEYHLYTLGAPSTIGNRQTKQIGFRHAEGVRARRMYVYDPRLDAHRARMTLFVENEKDNRLGKPMPKGAVRFTMADADGDALFVGEDKIDHTPEGEELELTVSPSWQVVGERTRTGHRRVARRVADETWRLTIRNHKDRAVNVRCNEPAPGGDWEVTRSTDAHTAPDVTTIRFEFTLDAHAQKTIEYTIRRRW